MRGEVLYYDETQGFGFIAGADGNRYAFAREDLRRAAAIAKGTQVEFKESGSQARDIFVVRGEARIAASATQPQPVHFGRDAVSEAPAGTGLWDYFRAAVTTNYFNFRGRARRKEYWSFMLFVILGGLALGALGGIVNVAIGDDVPGEMSVTTMTLTGIFLVAIIIPSIAIAVRRIHDIGLSGWFYLLLFLPYVGWLIMLVFALIPSQTRENKWGPVPAGIRIPPPYVPATPETSR